MASTKKPREADKGSNEAPQWAQIVEGFLSAVVGAFTGSVRAQAEEIAHDAERRISRLIVVAFLGVLGFVYCTIALVQLMTRYFSLATPWSFLIVGLLLSVVALAYSKR